MKDYYEILGVSPEATAEEIKSAFEGIIKRLTSEQNADSYRHLAEAEESFAVLSNPAARHQYDGFCRLRRQLRKDKYDGLDSGRSGPVIGAPKATGETDEDYAAMPDFESWLEEESGFDLSELLEMLGENLKNLSFELSGHETVFQNTTPSDVYVDLELKKNEIGRKKYKFLEYRRYVVCPVCRGQVKKEGQNCSRCLGRGRLMAKRRIEIKIPGRIKNNLKLQVRGEGHQNIGGQPAGDLFVRILIKNKEK